MLQKNGWDLFLTQDPTTAEGMFLIGGRWLSVHCCPCQLFLFCASGSIRSLPPSADENGCLRST